MKRLPRVASFALGLFACDFYADDPLNAPLGLSRAEHALIETELGILEAVAPPEPSNAFADDPAAAALGQAYFFDARYSSNGAISCATCHDPAVGYQDARAATSLGLAYTGRHAPTCLNAAVSRDDSDTNWQFWDGRSDSLWSQALGPPESDVEMGGSRTGVVYLIYDHYREPHEAIFGPLPELRDAAGEPRFPLSAKPGTPQWESMTDEARDEIDRVYVQFGKAIDAYERLLIRGNAPFDQWFDELVVHEERSEALTPSALRGLRLFIGKANCIACHRGPNFTDQRFHNLGVRQEGPYVASRDAGRSEGIAAAAQGEFSCASKWSDHPNKSACAVASLANDAADLGAFKTPSLRNVADTPPYMHTGHLATLEDVVRFYDAGGDSDGFVGTRDSQIRPLNLTEREIGDLVDFLESLSGDDLPHHLTRTPSLL